MIYNSLKRAEFVLHSHDEHKAPKTWNFLGGDIKLSFSMLVKGYGEGFIKKHLEGEAGNQPCD